MIAGGKHPGDVSGASRHHQRWWLHTKTTAVSLCAPLIEP